MLVSGQPMPESDGAAGDEQGHEAGKDGGRSAVPQAAVLGAQGRCDGRSPFQRPTA